MIYLVNNHHFIIVIIAQVSMVVKIGDVVLDLKKPTKTNNIKVSLEGCAEIGGKSTTIYSKSLYIAEPPAGEKSYYLEAHTHRFPFKMNIPPSSELKLPSTLEVNLMAKHDKNHTYSWFRFQNY